MVSTDPIADMLTRIRNAISVNQNLVSIPYSKMKATIAGELVEHGYIESVKENTEGTFKTLDIIINKSGSSPKITEIKRISKPGRRVYSRVTDIKSVKSGRGVVLLSTSKGVMSKEEAIKAKIGGEIICEVY